jgi:hypothetical protein
VKQLPGLLRLAAGVAIVVAVIGQFVYSAERGPINFFNFFGYFTTQSNIILMVAFFASAYFILSRKAQPSWVVFLRAAATTVIILVGLVYNTLLSGASLAGSFDLRWSSNILHVIIPIYALLDWILFADRKKLPYSKLWLVLIYPIVWIVVILIRGATDGWVPYPFLDPATGYGSVTVYCVAISVTTIVFGLGVYAGRQDRRRPKRCSAAAPPNGSRPRAVQRSPAPRRE